MILVLTMLSASGLTACGGGGGTLDDEPGATGVRPAPTPLVVLQRYGGLAGRNDRVSVDAIGVATLVSERSAGPSTRTLSSADLAALRRALERSEIATLQRNYIDRNAADAFQYDVTYEGITVTADEGVIPPSLRPVVDLLTRLIAS